MERSTRVLSGPASLLFPTVRPLSPSVGGAIADTGAGFHSNTTDWYNGEFKIFFDPETGVDVDGSWIDMNGSCHFRCFHADDPDWCSRTRQFLLIPL